MEEIIAGPGDEIFLSCPVNTEGENEPLNWLSYPIFSVCGAYHSLKWYHEDTRVYVFSPSAQFRNAEGALMNRLVIVGNFCMFICIAWNETKAYLNK